MMPKNKVALKSQFSRRLAYYYGLAFVIVFMAVGFFLKQGVEARLFKQIEESLIEQAQILSLTLPEHLFLPPETQTLTDVMRLIAEDRKARFTIIDTSGRVLADSKKNRDEIDQMDNHLNRPEMQAALVRQVGVDQRYSKTFGKESLYVAVPIVRKGLVIGVARLSLPVEEISIFLKEVKYPVWVSIFFGILCMFFLSIFLGGKITKRVLTIAQAAHKFSKGDLDQKIKVTGDDEFDFLSSSLNQMAATLKKRVVEREAEKEKSSIIFSNMAEGVIALNSRKEILLVNDSIGKIFHVEKLKVMGKSLIHVTKSPLIDRHASRVIKEKIRMQEKMTIYQEGEKILNVDLIGLDREDIAAILVFSDVTQIVVAEKMRREFVANVSHELRTPLTSIRGFIETLLSGALADEDASKRFLNIMDEDAKRLERLIADLLLLSKLESKEKTGQFEKICLKDIAEQVIERLRPQADQKRITFVNEICEGTESQVFADSDKMHQVFLNLMDNAIKFNREDGRVYIRSQRTARGIVVEIEDEGLGIPEDAITQIFERFTRVDKARSRDLGGTGLGLSIVKQIVELHGGSVTCESSYGNWTKFKFSLPFSQPKI